MKSHTLYLFALDPTHIGAGGYRLGRVDNTILRDAATGLPKIPGSSISGAVRAAAIYSLNDAQDRQKAKDYARATLDTKNKQHPHPGEEDPVAKIFGYAEGDEKGKSPIGDGKSRIGLVSFRDAEILAFPVPTMAGPRWVTTPDRLTAADCAKVPEVTDETCLLVSQRGSHPERMNLGWLLLNTRKAEIPLPELIRQRSELWHLQQNLVLAHANLFPSLVNANLETRTSVSLDFETGAAAESLLFTYEAVPRGALYRATIDFDDQRFPEYYEEAFNLVSHALKLACQLGLGAMTTRGFGRMLPILEGDHA